ncbi:hypothetical protein V2J09_011102 [Rumex salicifolius]
MGKVARCAADLKDCDYSVFVNVNRELRKVREDLRVMEKHGMFKWGDQNTSLFHKKTSGRKKRNTVGKLVDENGLEWCCFEGKEKVALDCFQSLFISKVGGDFDVAFQGIMSLLSRVDNDDSLAPFDLDEIKSVLFSMHPTKSLDPDNITSLVLFVLNEGDLPTNLNHTFISLIPKVNNKDALKQIEKVSGDNVLVAFELFHYMKKKSKGRKGFLALKVDMTKACDRVKWSFLEHNIRKLGFDDRWIALIMK